jgi:Flp pilus assembly protein TadG
MPMLKAVSFLKIALRRFVQRESGMTLPMLALSMVAVTGIIGMAIDMGRMQLVQSKLQFSLDAAALAAGSTASTSDLNAEVTKYLDANFNGYLNAILSGVTSQASTNIETINLSATATIPTAFLQIVGLKSIIVTANSQVSRQISGLEVTVIIDVSYGDDLADFKTGLTNFINTLFTSAAGQSNNLYVSIVPFNHTVNIGKLNTGWLTSASVTANNAAGWGPLPSDGWGGCVMARTGAESTIDDPPASGTTQFGQYYYASDTAASLHTKTNYVGGGLSTTQATNDFNAGPTEWQTLNNLQQINSWHTLTFAQYYGVDLWRGIPTGTTLPQYASPRDSNHQGPNFMCPPAIVPLTNNQQAVLNAINQVTIIQGDWLPDMGLEWGWNTISPRWQGLWTNAASGALPYNYGTHGWNKALVWVEGYSVGSGYVFQQGNFIDNNIYGGYGYLNQGLLGSTNMSTAINKIESNAQTICTNMKNHGIYVYLLGYSPDGSAEGLPSFMSSCATGQNYAFWFGPGDWGAFNTALNSIADSLVSLWLSK